MKLEVKVLNIGEECQGVSTTTGKAWRRRNILLGFEDETGESYLLAQVDGGLWEKLNVRQGDIVSLNLRFRTNRYRSGFIANDVRIVPSENI
ncbi:MAG: hypothetical protein IKP36_14115 [Bacteroidaceae bacterium]|nr:hypothetical protein [Bacteroidaceae bacterium]